MNLDGGSLACASSCPPRLSHVSSHSIRLARDAEGGERKDGASQRRRNEYEADVVRRVSDEDDNGQHEERVVGHPRPTSLILHLTFTSHVSPSVPSGGTSEVTEP